MSELKKLKKKIDSVNLQRTEAMRRREREQCKTLSFPPVLPLQPIGDIFIERRRPRCTPGPGDSASADSPAQKRKTPCRDGRSCRRCRRLMPTCTCGGKTSAVPIRKKTPLRPAKPHKRIFRWKSGASRHRGFRLRALVPSKELSVFIVYRSSTLRLPAAGAQEKERAPTRID